ncbi:DMT family transporter [Deinococcus sp. Leaf326]|uniref:DMT family transporter n=1 Tax=Deinococcus sp. Leaf326 TaxID=1736338 RepID=UPI0006F75083|nr:DMT family transporter [Deinococcus sp. Leaf326]KQQ97781.1 permease [Deinococcus sp. Leaf326]
MTPRLRGLLLLILVTAVWGSTFAVVKQLGEVLPPAVLIAWRFIIGALALLPAALLLRPARPAAAPTTPLWRDGLLLGAWLIAGYGTQTVALQTTGANRAAFFTALSVVLVPTWLVLAQRRRMPAALWAALPLAVAGLALLSWEGGQLVVGDLWALACAVTYAGFIVTLEKMARSHAPLPFTLAQVLSVAGLALVWAVIAEPGRLLPPPEAWWPLLYLGVVATALTTLLQTVGQRHVSAAEASLVYTLEPVTATAFSFVLIGEQVGLRGLLGGLLVVGATMLSTRGDSTPHAELPTPASER